jgi:hypothetical protein
MKNSVWALLLGASLLSACSSIPMITDIDVLTNQNNGSLVSFYNQLNADLQLVKPKTDEAENRREYIAITGLKIAEEKEQVILNDLDRELDKHSIATLEKSLAQATSIEPYNQKVYSDLRAQFEQAISQKKGLILAKEAEYYELTDKNAPAKVALLDEIAAIYGESESGSQIQTQRAAYIKSLYENANIEMTKKRYEDVTMLVDHLETIDPNYPGLGEMRHQLLAAEYEQQFWDALGKGQTDRAYFTFNKLTQIPQYVETHPDVVPIADDMAQFFIAEGDQWMRSKAIDSAYQSYSRARYIRVVTGRAEEYSVGEKRFIDYIEKRFMSYLGRSQTVPAFGHLMILKELMPAHEAVLKYSQSLQDTVLSDATIKILAMNFSNTTEYRALGSQLVAKINQAVIAAVGEQVKIIDEAVVATSYSPSQIVSMANSSSYYVLSGEILDAAVKQKNEEIAETQHVLTGYEKVSNPEHQEWLALSKRKRKDMLQPAPIIDQPVEQDVTIIKNVIEQKAALSVAYRLADAVSASVVFSDALVKEETINTVNIPRVEVGLFIQPEKKTELKTDAQILDALMQSMAEDAAQKLVAQVETLQGNYLRKADQALVLEDFNSASADYAYGFALSAAKQNADEDALSKLRTYSLRWQ